MRFQSEAGLVDLKFHHILQVHDDSLPGIFLEDHGILGKEQQVGEPGPAFAGTPDPDHHLRALDSGQQLTKPEEINAAFHTIQEIRHDWVRVLQQGAGQLRAPVKS